MITSRIFKIQHAEFIIYGFVFAICMLESPILDYDTYSYLRADTYRNSGYVIFSKVLKYISGSYFGRIALVLQTIFTLFAVNVFFKKILKLITLHRFIRFILIAILVFPFFSPLLVTVNISSEGLSYGLYLLLVTYGSELIFHLKKSTLLWFGLSYLVLTSVRGQFLFIPLFVFLTLLIQHRKSLFRKDRLAITATMIALPLVSIFLDKTYHYLKEDVFGTTPYGFVNASTAAFYVSDKDDINKIKIPQDSIIFKKSYEMLEAKNLLPKNLKDYDSAYAFFHENLPYICNQTIHQNGLHYFFDRINKKDNNRQKEFALAYFKTEEACKRITIALIKDNFSKYIKLYWTNITHGFYSGIILVFYVLVMVFSFFKVIHKTSKLFALVFLFSTLSISNAIIISFFGHSIMRYLFYNYALLFLILLLLFKSIRHERIS